MRNLLTLLLALCLSACASLRPDYPLPSGHRGDRDAGIENSRQSIQHAIDIGIPYIETDLRYSKDHKLVLYHDHKLHHALIPVSDVPENTAIADVPFATLRSVEIPNGGGILLDFDDVLDMLATSHAQLQTDLKGESIPLAKEVAETVRAHHMQKHILMQCQEVETAKFLRANYPDISILAISHEPETLVPFLELHPEVMQIEDKAATPEVVAQIKKNGAKILMKAVDTMYDNPRGWRHLRNLGADIVLTDHPQALERVY